MVKRESSPRNAITLLSLALLLILLLFVFIIYNYYDQIFYSNKSGVKSSSQYSKSYKDNSQNCVNLLVPYTERETYFEKVPAYNFLNTGYRYDADNLNYKVWVDQESISLSNDDISEVITIKVENRANDDSYFDVSVIFSPENDDKVTKHKTKFIREDDSEKFEFEYRHDEDQTVRWTYDIDSESEFDYRYSSDLSPYPYSHMYYRNDYVYDYDNCFHGYCKPTQIVSYREVPRVRMVTKYKTVTQCN